ncbi:hypothetical protein L6164_016382 [Bauhinia variegata]|uniref:Uncharacterized protein n=1 Tax=Bauhinia variegata TaxID=167791 RepID=A0ACB9NPK3_BAUVA|nr:hypothetical protein L6164_016382 [Bauhinia variegata]
MEKAEKQHILFIRTSASSPQQSLPHSTTTVYKNEALSGAFSYRRCAKSNFSVPQMPTTINTHGARHSVVPKYMAATASAKPRYRSQSAPRQRVSTPEKEISMSVKKSLSFPVPEPWASLANGGVDSSSSHEDLS